MTRANVLLVTASPNTEASVSTALAESLLGHLDDSDSVATVVRRDVGSNPPPHLDQATIAAFYTPPDDRSGEQQARVALSDQLVGEVENAALIVIASPMHNFGISSGLKAWIDHIARVGRTFRYTANGPEGLLKGRKVVVLSARGGRYGPDSGLNHLDHQEPYLKTALAFVGLDDVTFIRAEGTAAGNGGRDGALAEIAEFAVGLGRAAA